MADRVEFEIRGKRYPAPLAFRMVDPVLVEALTGLEWMDWTERLPDDDGRDSAGRNSQDPLVMLGMVGVAVWQANPTWRRERVVKFMETLSIDEVKAHGGDRDGEELPPAEAPTLNGASTTSAETSKPHPASDSDPTPVSSGLPG